LPFRHPRNEPCPGCGSALVDAAGRELRPIDLRFEELERWQRARYLELMAAGSLAAAVVALVAPAVPAAVVVAPPLMVIAHIVALRLVLVRRTVRYLSPRRRIVQRWLTRFGVLWIGGPAYAASAVPVVGVLPAVGAFALLTTVVHHHALWSLARERDRRPPGRWEWILVIGFAVLTLAALVVLAAAAAAVGWSVGQLLELVRAE
jgi:hypothetical protein